MTLRIETDKFYTQGGVLAPWYSDEKDKFEPRVKAALEQIRSTEVGSSLLRAIEGAGQQVLIVSAPQILDNKCAQADKGEQACKAACYAEVLDVGLLDKKFKQLKEEGKVTANHPGWKKYKKFYFKKDLKSTLTVFSRVWAYNPHLLVLGRLQHSVSVERVSIRDSVDLANGFSL